ncbi:MAG TPA: AAA family ATPase [Myxococcales bacterium]|nr:AAA family ATPase [Myxococcales bacterium]HIK86650.1 AAA family ATPase [Myxococcales bacterium]
MYNEYYGLIRSPFEMTPDPSFLYMGEAHREGLATLVYAVNSGKGFVMLTGEVGTGKTTLLHALLSQLDSSTNSAFIFNPRLDPMGFFRMLFEELGVGPACDSKAEYLLALNQYLIDKLAANERVLLIVDEAQNLSTEMLEEIRLLSNLETPTSKLIQIMLVGQPELQDLIDQPELRQLRQRISLRHHLRPFDEGEVTEYVNERLNKAGYTGRGIFKKKAIRELYYVTEGTPRMINNVCDGALLLGYARQETSLGADAIREVAHDLGFGPKDESEGNGKVGGKGSPSKRRSKRRLFRFRR